MQLFHPLENVLVFFNCVRKRIVTGGMLERRRVLIVDDVVIESLSYRLITNASSFNTLLYHRVVTSNPLLLMTLSPFILYLLNTEPTMPTWHLWIYFPCKIAAIPQA